MIVIYSWSTNPLVSTECTLAGKGLAQAVAGVTGACADTGCLDEGGGGTTADDEASGGNASAGVADQDSSLPHPHDDPLDRQAGASDPTSGTGGKAQPEHDSHASGSDDTHSSGSKDAPSSASKSAHDDETSSTSKCSFSPDTPVLLAKGKTKPIGKIKKGDALNTATDTHATVLSTHATPGTANRWNLTVQQLHTYYVVAGATPILVHNTDGPSCEIFPNLELENRGDDLAEAKAAGVAPTVPGTSEFDSYIANPTGEVKWGVRPDGSLRIVPTEATDGTEIFHSTLNGDVPGYDYMRAAGTAEIEKTGTGYTGKLMTNYRWALSAKRRIYTAWKGRICRVWDNI